MIPCDLLIIFIIEIKKILIKSNIHPLQKYVNEVK